jgi:hypothetical protein
MAYYWVTESQRYIQSLGFGSTRRAVNKESQDIRINQYGVDNSFSWDKKDLLRFGKGGMDDARVPGPAAHSAPAPGPSGTTPTRETARAMRPSPFEAGVPGRGPGWWLSRRR